MADRPLLPPLREWKLEPTLPCKDTKSDSVRQSSEYVGFQKPPNDRILLHDGVFKEDFQIESCSTEANHIHTGVPRYQCVVGDHVPRYIPSEPHGPCKALESHPLFQEEDISSHYTHKLPSMSKGSEYQSSSPYLGMPSLENRWITEEHESDSRTESKTESKPLSVATKLQIMVPSTPGDSDTVFHQGAAQRSLPENNFGRRSSTQVLTSDANMDMLHVNCSPNQLEDEKFDAKLAQNFSELSFATMCEPNQPDSTDNTETPENYPPDTESESEGEWLTGRYIPGFLRDQWLNGSALEIPTTEACALAVVKEALVDQIMTKLPVFDPKWTANLISNTGSRSNSSPSNTTSKSNKLTGNNSSSPNRGRKRSFDDDDDDESPAGGKDGPPDPPGPNLFASQPREDSLQLACPFRKHDPEKYSLREYRVCATKPWDSINRLKQHLNTVHKAAVYCNKCKEVFETAEGLEIHQNVPDFRTCRHKDLPPPAGVTPAMEAKLRGRWKASTQASWRRIFQILFPNETIPSPDFDQIPDIQPAIGSPSQHEFRCLVQTRLGELVDEGFNSLCERTISRLVDVVEDCYVQINLGHTKFGDVGHGESPISNRYDRQINELFLQSSVGQQLDCDGIGSSNSPMWGGTRKGKEIEINASVSPPQFSSTAPLDLQDSSVDSSLSTCSATTSSDTALPKLDLQVDDMYVEQYASYWDGAPTDMATFDSFVEMDD